jgi:hypothetical protein
MAGPEIAEKCQVCGSMVERAWDGELQLYVGECCTTWKPRLFVVPERKPLSREGEVGIGQRRNAA